MLNKAIAAIEEQQARVKARSPQWMVGEQLKDICRREPKSAELIAQDLTVKEMSITEAEKILREFYGLPEPFADSGADDRGEENQEDERRNSGARKVIDLDAFF